MHRLQLAFCKHRMDIFSVSLLQELDDVWSEFLRDVDSVKTAVGVRAFAHLSPDDEFRLEASKTSQQSCLMHSSG